jgi:putative hemolysin
MTLQTLLTVVSIAFWLLLAGFFSGAETGMYSLNRFRLGARASERDRDAMRLHKMLSRPGELIMTLLVGTNLSIYAATAGCTNLCRDVLAVGHQVVPAIVTTLVMSPAVLVFAEMIPKEIFRRRPWQLPYSTSRAVRIFTVVFKLPVIVLRIFVLVVERAMKANGNSMNPFFSRQQLADLTVVAADEGVISPHQADMARKVMKLGKVKLADVMVPMRQVTMVDRETSVNTFLRIAQKRRHSRIPVFDKSHDRVVGLVNIFDVFYQPGQGTKAADYVEPVIRLADHLSASQALPVLQHEKRVMALVVDAQGKPAGIVTVKDLVEEIAGDLADW